MGIDGLHKAHVGAAGTVARTVDGGSGPWWRCAKKRHRGQRPMIFERGPIACSELAFFVWQRLNPALMSGV